MSSKKELLLGLLAESDALVRLDGRADGVDLPEWLRTDPAVVLQLGYDLAVPIHDLEITDEGIRATLSFRRTPHRCTIPWAAVYGIGDSDGRSMVFPESVPVAAALPPEPAPDPDPKPKRGSHLKLVK